MKKGNLKSKLLLKIKDNLSKFNIFLRKNRKYNKLFVLSGIAFVIFFAGIAGLNYIYENLEVAKAEDIVSTTPVAGQYTGKLILSPDNSTIYTSTGGSQSGIAKYDAATNALLATTPGTNFMGISFRT